MKSYGIGAFEIGGATPLFATVGPCVIESEEHARFIARAVTAAAAETGVPTLFKASFDKANRTSVGSFRGPGLGDGLRILAAVKAETGLPVVTDIHEPAQAEAAAEVCDILQIPAFLCRQTDLLTAAGRTGLPVQVKKGQFLAPADMRWVAEKVASTGNRRIILVERGTTFGYNNLVVDMRGLQIMRELGFPVVLDVTHSLQMPGAGEGKSGGAPEFIETLARAGVAAGVDGVFFEVHEAPEHALSDGANALRLDRLKPLLGRLRRLGELVRGWNRSVSEDD